MSEDKDSGPLIGRDERERAHDAAEAEARPERADDMGVEGNESDVNRKDTQNTSGDPTQGPGGQIAPREEERD